MLELYRQLLELTDRIEAKWLEVNYATEVFCDVVWDLTGDVDLSPLGEVSNQLTLLDHSPVRALQVQNTFSDFYFRVFDNGRFFIEVLNWWGGQVNAHDHDFSGVQFQLKGEALNVVHDFRSTESHGALRLGELSARRAEVWREGGRMKVYAGDVETHSVFHLGQPTTSLIIRSQPTLRFGAQSNYFKNLAAHYYVNTVAQRKKLTALRLLSQGDEAGFRERFVHCLATQSLSENLFMMVKLGTVFLDPRYAGLVAAYSRKGRLQAEVVRAALTNTAEDVLRDLAQAAPASTAEERMAVHALIASRDATDFKTIQRDLRAAGKDAALAERLDRFRDRLDAQQRRRFGVSLAILGARLPEPAAAAADADEAVAWA